MDMLSVIRSKTNLLPITEDFYQLVSDYEELIKDNSQLIEIPAEIRSKYNYRLKDILMYLNVPIELYWITAKINKLTSINPLVNQQFLYVPDINYLKELQIKHKSILTQKLKQSPINIQTYED